MHEYVTIAMFTCCFFADFLWSVPFCTMCRGLLDISKSLYLPSKPHMEPLTGDKRDNVMHGVVSGSVRKWLWVPSLSGGGSVRYLQEREKHKWGNKWGREHSLNAISFLSEWKSSCSFLCRQVLREMQMLAFSVGRARPHNLFLLHHSFSEP